MCIPATNSFRIGQSVSWFTHKSIMSTTTATDINIATAKDLTAASRQINKNPLLPPYDTITCKEIFQLDSIFYNAYSALKPQPPPTFKLPRLFTPKPISSPPRVSSSITQYFYNIYPTTQKHCRDLWVTKPKASPKTSPFSYPSPNSSPTLTLTLPLLTTLMLPSQLWIFLSNYNIYSNKKSTALPIHISILFSK